MVTDGMLTVSGLLQLRLGRPAINQPSTCTKFFVSEWQCLCMLSVLSQFRIPAGQSTFLSLLFIFRSSPKRARKEKWGLGEETHPPVISKWHYFLPASNMPGCVPSFYSALHSGFAFSLFSPWFFLGCAWWPCVLRSFIVSISRTHLSGQVCAGTRAGLCGAAGGF